MKIGIIGLPNSGKTTVFNALTGATVELPLDASCPYYQGVQKDDYACTR